MKHVDMSITSSDDIWDFSICLTFRATIADTVISDHLYARLYNLNLFADELLTDSLKRCSTISTDPLIFRDVKIDFLNWKVCKFISHCGFSLPGMFLDCDEIFFLWIRSCLFSLGLIEEIQLSFEIIISFFAGFAKEFLGKIIDLLLENLLFLQMFLLAFVGSVNEGIEILYCSIQFFDGILQLNELLVLGISGPVLPPLSDI